MVRHLSTIFVAPKNYKGKMRAHALLTYKTFPTFHISFESYLYMRYSYVYVPSEEGGGGAPKKIGSGCAARYSFLA